MGVSKTEDYTAQQIELSTLTKALGHPARIAIMDYLLKSDSCICSDIVSELPLSQSTISAHLKELKNAGLIKGNVEGTAICYCIEPTGLKVLQNYFQNIFSALKRKKDSCC